MNGREIKIIRTKTGMTQKQLAETVGVSTNTVARWERDVLGISDSMVDRLLDVAASIPSGTTVSRTSSIVLDPFHREILVGLNTALDPGVFEACAVELLQQDWPRLVPVRGGQDQGFDGAVSDSDSKEPFPLITTTGKSLVRNFKSSIESSKRGGWHRRRALFATSQRITPTTRRKLYQAARECDVTLVQTYDQDWFAGRLYHNPEWCKRLLNISGKPHALSVFPVSGRPVLGDEILGRDHDMKVLLNSDRDCMLVGAPGSGKTFLLRALALEGKALFLVDDDREQIANDLRSMNPKAVIIDDAHVQLSSVRLLAQLRNDIHASFRIIVSSWPGESQNVRSELHVGDFDVVTLDLIDADTMVEIIKSVGIVGPNELLYTIRKQAAGRPGLATTLAHLCLIGNVNIATSGEGLVDSLAPALDRLLGLESMRVLAPFALGGNAGARLEDVAKQMHFSLLELSSSLARLGAAGIVAQSQDSTISVEPPPMRWILVRRVFFDNLGSLPIEPFLSIVRNRDDAIQTLIGARARGATIPNLDRIVEESNSKTLWRDYASLGPDTTQIVLRRHPESIKELAEPALEFLPEQAIPMLLFQMQEECKLGEALESTKHLIEKWVKSGNSRRKRVAIERRRTLLSCTKSWWRQTGNSAVSIAAMCIALDPDFDFLTQDPGIGRQLTISLAKLDAELIQQLSLAWPDMKTVLDEASDIPWVKMLDLLARWCHARISADDDTRDAVGRFRSQMLNDLALASRKYPGVQHRISELATSVDAIVETNLDETFERMFPSRRRDSKGTVREYQSLGDDAVHLAKRWKNRTSSDIAKFLGHLESEALRAGISYPRFTPVFCKSLAGELPDPAATTCLFMRERLPADLVDPFLNAAVAADSSAWSIVSDCLEDGLYVGIGSQLAFCHTSAPSEIVLLAIDKAQEVLPLLEHWCIRREVSQNVLSEIFRSQVASTAVFAAIGHWQAFGDSETQIPLLEAWRGAILRSAEISLSTNDYYWIGEILKTDADLAIAWLIRLIEFERRFLDYGAEEVVRNAVNSLSSDQRISVLASIRPCNRMFGITDIVRALVGTNTEVYRFVLQSETLKDYRLAPLMTELGDDWRNIAVLALDHGLSCAEVMDASVSDRLSWSGNESDMWMALRQRFEILQNDDDSRIARIGQLGAETIIQHELRAKEDERKEAIYGIS